jgi:hypothetical protein
MGIQIGKLLVGSVELQNSPGQCQPDKNDDPPTIEAMASFFMFLIFKGKELSIFVFMSFF